MPKELSFSLVKFNLPQWNKAPTYTGTGTRREMASERERDGERTELTALFLKLFLSSEDARANINERETVNESNM